MHTNAFLETESLSYLMRKYSIPCIISLLVAALYNIVDQIFIANASYLGSYGNVANTVVYPLTIIALAIAVMIGDGSCAFVSLSLGSKEIQKAKISVGNAVVLTVLCSGFLTLIYLGFSTSIINGFGADVNQMTFQLSKEYFFYITLGIPFYMFGQMCNPIIRADGSPRFAMISTVMGAILNLILDPLFIYGFHWGMMGAAVATVLGQVVTAILAIYYLLHLKTMKLDKESLHLNGHVIARFIPMGICSMLSQISLVFAMAAVNNMIRTYGALDPVFSQAQYAQIPMAVVGIVMKFFQIVISIVVGMAAGCIPIVGYNMGAGRTDRVKDLFKRLLMYEFSIGVIALIITQCFPQILIGLFGAANESTYYTDFAIRCFRTYLCMLPLACVNKAVFIYIQSLGKALLSTLLSMIREIGFGVGLVLLLPMRFGLDGVLYSMPLSDFLTFIISAISVLYVMRLLKEPRIKNTVLKTI